MPRDWKGGNASTFKTIGASNHCAEERAERDYYATEPAATEWLCRLEKFTGPILEPSCGEGHMSRILEADGYEVVSRDIEDRGYGEVADFLAEENTAWDGDIVTNPPYAFAQDFVQKSMEIIPDGRKVAMFLKLTFLEGKGRRKLFEKYPPGECGSAARGSTAPRTGTSSTPREAPLPTHGSYGRKAFRVVLRYGGSTDQQ
jgi:hypothetical protein